MGSIRQAGRRAPWNATKKQAKAHEQERVLRARVAELETDLVNVRNNEKLLSEALVAANAAVARGRQAIDEAMDPNRVVIHVHHKVRDYLVEMARSGFWGRNLEETAAQVIREHVRELVASGKVKP